MKKIESWNDLTVGQYQEMMSVQTENELSRFIECMAIALDCDPQDIRDKPYGDWQELSEHFRFISKQPGGTHEDIIEIDGIQYGIEPNMRSITTGVFIDAEQFKNDPIPNLHRTLALIYRPITKTFLDGSYEIEAHKSAGFERRADLFRDNMSPNVAVSATLFFSIVGMELSIRTLDFLIEQTKEMTGETTTPTILTPTKKLKQKRFRKTGVSIIK